MSYEIYVDPEKTDATLTHEAFERIFGYSDMSAPVVDNYVTDTLSKTYPELLFTFEQGQYLDDEEIARVFADYGSDLPEWAYKYPDAVWVHGVSSIKIDFVYKDMYRNFNSPESKVQAIVDYLRGTDDFKGTVVLVEESGHETEVVL